MATSKETQRLYNQVEDQVERLLKQLEDLESCKEDLEAQEYAEMRADTVEQLQQFQDSLARLASGDMTLLSQYAAVRLAIQATISEAFRTPEIIKLFAKKQPAQLRFRLVELERDCKTGKLNLDSFNELKGEILCALKKLGEDLSAAEEAHLASITRKSFQEFVKVTDSTAVSEEKLKHLTAKS